MSWDQIQALRQQLEAGEVLAVLEPLQALRSSWPEPVVAQLLAAALIRCGRAPDALACLQQDISAGIANHWTHYWLGTYQADLGDLQAAAAAFRRCHALQGWSSSETQGYTFTHDPCSAVLPSWQAWFATTITTAPIRIVELGSQQGCFSLWLLDQVVAPRGGQLTCIDTWEDGAEHSLRAALGLTLEQLFEANVARSPGAGQLQKRRGRWQELLPTLPAAGADLVVIHTAREPRAVLESGVHAHRLLAPGGFLLFADAGPATSAALECFCASFAEDLNVCERGSQLLLQRRHHAQLPPRLLFVLGMHRSGTSALSGLLCHHGFTGPHQPDPPGADNPTGYWEPPAVRSVHDQLLASHTCCWDDLMLPADLLAGQAREACFERLERALQQDYPGLSNQQVALIKDPRQCRLQSLWNALLQKHQLQASALLVLRHPLAVALSLQTRNRLPLGRSLLLWLAHTLEAERHSRSLPRCVVAYERLLQDPAATLQVCRDLAALPALPAAELDLAQWIRPELNHAPAEQTGHTFADAVDDPDLLTLALQVHEHLAAHHGAPVPEDRWPFLDEAHAELQRRLYGLMQQGSRLELVQLFWEPAGGGGFSEEASIRHYTTVGRGTAAIELTLPEQATAPLQLRLDPSEQPGVISLQRLELCDASGASLWCWQAGAGSSPPPCTSITPQAAFLPDGQLVAADHDPGLALQIPPATLQQLGEGCRLRLDAQWQPLPAQLARHLLQSALEAQEAAG